MNNVFLSQRKEVMYMDGRRVFDAAVEHYEGDRLPFTALTAFDPALKTTVISLMYNDRENPSQSIIVCIAPDLGSNMFRFRVGAHDLIYCDPELLKKADFTGNFVLWPFPNRVRDKRYMYRGNNYSFEDVKRPQGNDVLIHGLVFDRQWHYEQPLFRQESVSVTTFIDITPESPFYQSYPFDSRLSLTYTLARHGITVAYHVQNKSTYDMPFGFALHPYFSTLSGRENTLVRIPATHVMEADTELLPTGRLLDVREIMYAMFDLRRPVAVENLTLDHVYTGLQHNGMTTIEYKKEQIKLDITTSEVFTHIVIFTGPPKTDSAFFCIENQTCSTDAINLHNRGLREMAHLLELHPGESSRGFIRYAVSDIQ